MMDLKRLFTLLAEREAVSAKFGYAGNVNLRELDHLLETSVFISSVERVARVGLSATMLGTILAEKQLLLEAAKGAMAKKELVEFYTAAADDQTIRFRPRDIRVDDPKRRASVILRKLTTFQGDRDGVGAWIEEMPVVDRVLLWATLAHLAGEGGKEVFPQVGGDVANLELYHEYMDGISGRGYEPLEKDLTIPSHGRTIDDEILVRITFLEHRLGAIERIEKKVAWMEQRVGGVLDLVVLPVMVSVLDREIRVNAGRHIVRCALRFLRGFGFQSYKQEDWIEVNGSFFKRLKVAIRSIWDKESTLKLVSKVSEGMENQFVRVPGSVVDLNQAEAASRLIGSIEHVDNAVVVIGPTILVKRTRDGAKSLFVVPLTQRIKKYIEENPFCVLSPELFCDSIRAMQDDEVKKLADGDKFLRHDRRQSERGLAGASSMAEAEEAAELLVGDGQADSR
ncbi:hypothetical protein [Haliangium ochraceum]|uniref:Uncharacterized protein n=1 Tax=Haliangium ochraceum (strain DSM 14365 / JCM 11303 / SMP-2) TaxID=502025 RepID=D0LPC7_HALO1|nr:hypothetical protein [Haliangium ochraceum]ACY13492.1 hypothetical protein Hoch_0879 [Haliangium ochraceum DSM 14365]